MKLHPLTFILLGLFVCSIGLNICLWESNKRLVYKVQKLEAGPARGLFLDRQIPQPENKKLDNFRESTKHRLTKIWGRNVSIG